MRLGQVRALIEVFEMPPLPRNMRDRFVEEQWVQVEQLSMASPSFMQDYLAAFYSDAPASPATQENGKEEQPPSDDIPPEHAPEEEKEEAVAAPIPPEELPILTGDYNPLGTLDEDTMRLTFANLSIRFMEDSAQMMARDMDLYGARTAAILQERGVTAADLPTQELRMLVVQSGASFDVLSWALRLDYATFADVTKLVHDEYEKAPHDPEREEEFVAFYQNLRCSYHDIWARLCHDPQLREAADRCTDRVQRKKKYPGSDKQKRRPPAAKTKDTATTTVRTDIDGNPIEWLTWESSWSLFWGLRLSADALRLLGCTGEDLIGRRKFYLLEQLSYLGPEGFLALGFTQALLRSIPGWKGADLENKLMRELGWPQQTARAFLIRPKRH